MASISLYRSNDGWLSQRHSTQQLIPGPTGDDQLLHYGTPIGPGIRARLHSEAVTNRTWLSSYQIHRALISDPFSKPRQGSGLAYLDSYLFTFQYHQVERLRDQGWRGSLNATYPAFLYRTDPRSIV